MNTQTKYTIYDVSDALSSGAVEYLGSKRKGWLTYRFKDKDSRILFKQGRRGTGENWAEKVTCELADLLGLPHASYELAYLAEGEPCVISPSFLLEVGEELRLGNELIEGFDRNQKFKNTKHTLPAILQALQQNKVQLPLPKSEYEMMITNANDLFIGYLCFDAWVANTDRHAENWGIITKTNHTNMLAPTFDHASSLGRNESDENREKRLKTKDKGYNVQAYVQRALVPIYDDNGHNLNTKSLVQECKRSIPEATDYWIKKIIKIMSDGKKIRMILDQVPDEFITVPAKDFAMAILNENAKWLRELQND